MKAIYTIVNSSGKPGDYRALVRGVLSSMTHISGDDNAYEFNFGREPLPTGIRILSNAETQLEFLSSSKDGVENAERRIFEARKEVSSCFEQEGLKLT